MVIMGKKLIAPHVSSHGYLPEYKELFLDKATLNKRGINFELYGGNLMLVFSSSGELLEMKDFVRGEVLKFGKKVFTFFDGDKDFDEIKFLKKKINYEKNMLEISQENGEIFVKNLIAPTKKAIAEGLTLISFLPILIRTYLYFFS